MAHFKLLDRLRDNPAKRDGGPDNWNSPLPTALEVEQVGDHPRHPIAARPDAPEYLGLGEREVVVEKHPGSHDDAVQGIAQIVADDAEKHLVFPQKHLLCLNGELEIDARSVECGRERSRVSCGFL